MDKYNTLLNKKINFQLEGNTLQSYKITEIRQTDRVMAGLEGSGKIYNCDIEWLQKVDNPFKINNRDEKTIDKIISKIK